MFALFGQTSVQTSQTVAHPRQRFSPDASHASHRIPFFSAPLDSNSLLLVGSDGALSVLTAARLASLVRGCRSMQQLTERLYEDVRAAGGEDNFTLMASRILVS